MIKSTFPTFIVNMFLILCPAKAMMDDSQEKERLKVQPANFSQQSSLRKETSSLTSSEVFPDDLLLSVFKLLDVDDLGRVAQVSFPWKRVVENPDLWKCIGSQYYGDYLSIEKLKENSKKQVVFHYLSVIVNATKDLKKIGRLINVYKLYIYELIFKKYVVTIFSSNLVSNKEFICQAPTESIWKMIDQLCVARGEYSGYPLAALELNELLVKRGNSQAINRKIEGLTQDGKSIFFGYCGISSRGGIFSADYGNLVVEALHGYKKNLPEARDFNDSLVERGDQEAIERKIEGFIEGKYGYEQNQYALRMFNELLVEKGNPTAIERKIEGLTEGKYGYEQNPYALRMFNELLVEKEDMKAIKRKLKGLAEGKHGYTKDLLAARELNNFLAENGDSNAISRKIWGLANAEHGYDKDQAASKILCELLIEKGDPWAIETKFACLSSGECGYEKNPSAATDFLEPLIERGNQKAILTKIIGLAEGEFGYRKDPLAARELNNLFIEKDDPWAIKRKIEGLTSRKYGYERDLAALREFNEFLVEKGNKEAIERKIDGLSNGKYGYEQNLEALKGFNNLLVEWGDPKAIQRKVEGLAKGSYGYTKSPAAVREFIETLVINEFPVARGIGKYIKAFAMKYGVIDLGYERDRENAIRFIKENYVPY